MEAVGGDSGGVGGRKGAGGGGGTGTHTFLTGFTGWTGSRSGRVLTQRRRGHSGGTGKKKITTNSANGAKRGREEDREEGLEEIARRYLLQPVGGFPPG